MDFVTEVMLCKVFRPGDGKPFRRPRAARGLLSPIRDAKLPHGLSCQIIRARSAKRQSDLTIVTFVPNTIYTKNSASNRNATYDEETTYPI